MLFAILADKLIICYIILYVFEHETHRGPCMSTVVLYCWCHSDSASVLLYFTFQKRRESHSIDCLSSNQFDEWWFYLKSLLNRDKLPNSINAKRLVASFRCMQTGIFCCGVLIFSMLVVELMACATIKTGGTDDLLHLIRTLQLYSLLSHISRFRRGYVGSATSKTFNQKIHQNGQFRPFEWL